MFFKVIYTLKLVALVNTLAFIALFSMAVGGYPILPLLYASAAGILASIPLTRIIT